MEDVRIGRETQHGYREVTATNAGNVTLCSADSRRTVLMLSVAGAVAAFAGPKPFLGALDTGFRLSEVQPPLILDIQTHGTIVCEQWSASGDGADVVVSVIEGWLEKR